MLGIYLSASQSFNTDQPAQTNDTTPLPVDVPNLESDSTTNNDGLELRVAGRNIDTAHTSSVYVDSRNLTEMSAFTVCHWTKISAKEEQVGQTQIEYSFMVCDNTQSETN